MRLKKLSTQLVNDVDAVAMGCIPSNNSKRRRCFGLILIQFMIPQLSHRLFIGLEPFKTIEEGWIKKFALVNPVACQGDTATQDFCFQIGGKAVV